MTHETMPSVRSSSAGNVGILSDIREMLLEQVQYRELLWQMTKRDLMLRYKQTVMGFGWAVFMPLVNTLVFSIVFTRLAPLDVGMPYPLYAFSGLLAWNFFASSLKFAVNSLTSNTSLVTKVYFPREIFPISAVAVSVVDLCVASLVLVVLMMYYGVAVTPAIALLPIVVLAHVTFTAAIALVLAMGNIFYRDVKYLFEVLLTVWMFVTNVLYPVTLVGGRTAKLLELNPMTQVIDAYRDVLLRGQVPSLAFVVALLASLVMLAVAWLWFHRSEYLFAENA